MEQIVSENLFLLEFLVDKCIILPCAIPKEIQQVTGETCVSFKFMDNEPLDICEADFTPKRNYTDEENMKSGKSCLFAMSSTQAEEALTEFDVVVGVFKKLTNGMLPDKIQIGTAVIPVATMFSEIIQMVKEGTEQQETVSRTLKDCFNITNINFEVIGSISVFIRMSCFGKLIVTQFQMNLEDKSVFFKDKEGKSLYKYRKATKDDRKEGKTCKPLQPVPAESRGETFDGRCQECTTTPDMGQYSTQFPSQYPSQYPPQYPGQYPGQYAGQYPEPVLPVEAPLMPYNSQLNDQGNFQEIGAEMNGNALTIRVHKNKAVIKRLDGGEECEALPEGKSYLNDPCNCISPGVVSRQTRNGNNCYCLSPPMPQQQQQRNNPCADKQVLSLKPADDPKNPFAFRVSGCPGGGGNQNVTVVSPTNTRPDGMQVTEISDPTKDVFVLRIGKKSEGTDKKANLELELVTPKGLDRKPIPKKETRETQYNEKDAGPETAKAGKGKGKKGKKGKGDGSGDAKKKTGTTSGGCYGGGGGAYQLKERPCMDYDCCYYDPCDCYNYCYPSGYGNCCTKNMTCWNVPSRTNICCSMGKITSARACCYCPR